MTINRTNYEIYFLDYSEGTLNPELIEELNQFLIDNPDLAEELYAFENISLKPEPVSFENKNMLKKESGSENFFDELCIKKIEGIIDPQENILFESLINDNHAYKSNYELYVKTILKPDMGIVFNGKSELKKHIIGKRNKYIYFGLSAAASIALIFGAIKFIYNGDDVKNQLSESAIKPKIEIVTKQLAAEPTIVKQNDKPVTKQKVQKKPVSTIKKQEVKNEKKNERNSYKVEYIKGVEIYEVKCPVLVLAPIASNYRPSVPATIPEQIDENNNNLKRVLDKKLTAMKRENIGRIKGIDFWLIAQKSLKKINEVTGTDLELKRQKDTTTNEYKYSLDSKLLSLNSTKN